jgi:hypothetical protein
MLLSMKGQPAGVLRSQVPTNGLPSAPITSIMTSATSRSWKFQIVLLSMAGQSWVAIG